MTKFVQLQRSAANGRATWTLVGPTGARIAAFDAFMKSHRSAPFNTRRSYAQHLARFIDYLYAAEAHFRLRKKRLTRDDLEETLLAYKEYLTFGTQAGNELSRSIAGVLPPRKLVSASTCDTMHAPVRKFLVMSERVRNQLRELKSLGLTQVVPDDKPLSLDVGKSPIPLSQQIALREHSMLAGVISGGPRLLPTNPLPSGKRGAQQPSRNPFPFQYVVPVLESMTTRRDEALNCLCAAAGCRQSEALQLLWSDINVREGTVRLVDPGRRINHPSYLHLTPEERDRLEWKGRTTDVTLLIEPFASRFFEALQKYVEEEYIPHGLHEFVFQHLRTTPGRPYFLSADSTRAEVFERAVRRAIPDPTIRAGLPGVHGLRGMYISYLVNYVPRADGTYGMNVAMVRPLVGHAKATSTERYVQYDKDLQLAELAYANAMVFSGGQGKTLNEMKRDVLEARLREVQRAIAEETCAC